MIRVKKDKYTGDILSTGRRKSSIARIRIRPGNGKITINQRELEEYFLNQQDRNAVLAPLESSEKQGELDIVIRVTGGGMTGQSGACRMGIARALAAFYEELFPVMREGGFMARDSRMKERKKCGLHGARRGTQFSKR